ncbi:MAG: hypothetical protein LBU00_00280, partial [Treponema sp.]|nr:hypothetical protein [Treponema sp.]
MWWSKTFCAGLAFTLALVFFAAFPGVGGAQSSQGFPSLTPDSRALDFARRGAGASWEDLAEIALWASALGMDAPVSQDSGASMDTLRRAVGELRAAFTGADARDRGDYILSYMHRNF